ncbi:MAG TPA: hypothetical protein VJM75_09760 [Acidimicrobiales bacterium]|nr:hypothetical protein [Acidimicrobiales bacterium]
MPVWGGVGEPSGGLVKMSWQRAFLLIAALFLILSIWNNPTGTANAFGDFLGNVGSWLEDALDRSTEFIRGLTD